MAAPMADNVGDIAPTVRRTYGKAKPAPFVVDADLDSPSLTLADSSLDATQSSQSSQGSHTRYSGSNQGDESFKTRVDSEPESASPSKPAKYGFGRKTQHKLLDDESTDEDAAPHSPSKSAPKLRATSVGEPDGSSPPKSYTFAWKAKLEALDAASDDELDTLTRRDAPDTSPTPDTVKERDAFMSSPAPARLPSSPPPTRRLPSSAPSRISSDDEAMLQKPTSPSRPPDVDMASPRMNASTQPWSDEDDDASKPSKHTRRKSKPKNKGLSKKEREEMNKETVRLVAQQQASLQPAQAKTFTLSGLLQSFTTNLKPSPIPAPPDSDPIDGFSSSPAHVATASVPRPRLPDTKPSSRRVVTAPQPSKSRLEAQSSITDPDVFLDSSSPTKGGRSFGAPLLLLGRGEPSPSKVSRAKALPDPASSDEEMPEIGDIFAAEKAKSAEQARRRQLADIKARALQQQQQFALDDSDDDLQIVEGDMHLVIEEEAAHRRGIHASGKKASEGRKRQLALARGGSSPVKPKQRKALTSIGVPVDKGKGKAKDVGPTSQHELNRMLLKEANKKAEAERKAREDEWVKRGGTLKAPKQMPAQEDAWEVYAQRASEVKDREMQEANDVEDDDEDPEDLEWRPEVELGSGDEAEQGRGRSQSIGLSGAEADMEDETGDVEEDARFPIVREDDDENDENQPPPVRAPRRSRAVVTSDTEEEDENMPPPRQPGLGRVLVPGTSRILEDPVMAHRASVSSLDMSDGEEATDKENDTSLMFDHGDDKENTAVVRHREASFAFTDSPGNTPPAAQPHRMTDLARRLGRGLSMTPGGLSDDENAGAGPSNVGASASKRTPLGVLETKDEDDIFATPVSLGKRNLFAELMSSTPKDEESSRSPAGKSLAPSPDLKEPAQIGVRLQLGGGLGMPFSQFLGTQQDVPGENAPDADAPAAQRPAALQAGFSQFFNEGSQQAGTPPKRAGGGGFDGFFSPTQASQPPAGFAKLRQPLGTQALGLTLPSHALEPVLQVSESVRRRADDIFEKEQEYIIQAALPKRGKSPEPELYVRDDGFLTQTRPSANAEPYHPTPTQRRALTQAYSIPPSASRKPLSTISLASDERDEEEVLPLRRLKRRSSPAEEEEDEEDGGQLSPSPTRPNAFDMLRRGARKDERKAKKARMLKKSEFVEGEAAESDDDAKMGFGGLKKAESDDEEESGDEQDKIVEGLVDDATMDAETEALDKVLEKHKEQLEEDDVELQKLHQNAVEGKLRAKRRDRGVGFEDSDSDDDDEDMEAKRRRQKIAKKRKIKDDTLDALGENDATRAFFMEYQKDIAEDDNAEFAHLAVDHMNVVDVGEQSRVPEDEDGDESSEEEAITAAEVRQRLREVAQQNTDAPEFNPENVDYVDLDLSDDDDQPRVREVTWRPKAQLPRRAQDFEAVQHPIVAVDSERDSVRMKTWAKGESRGGGSARPGLGGAVTGHGKKAGGSFKTGQRPAAGPERKPLKAQPSLLSAVSSKSGRFGARPG